MKSSPPEIDAASQPAPHRVGARPDDASSALAPECSGQSFYAIDPSLPHLLRQRLEPALREHLEPRLRAFGDITGNRLDDLARLADRNPPVLHARDRCGRDEDWIEYHPAYREMEQLAYGDLGLHAMGHRGGVLDWPQPLPAVAKYSFQYLFAQAEFGLLCPVSVTDTTIWLLRHFADDGQRRRYLPRLLSQDLESMWKGAHFMTEKTGGSDVGALRSEARRDGDAWRVWGDKWFCSHADADVVLLLARPQGAPSGTAGLGLFAMPRRLEDGSRNRYRIARLKEKLGTRSMASGEVLLEGAWAEAVGPLDRGFKQMMAVVNLSRLSHGIRAAGMMRRCYNESLAVARGRRVFGVPLIEQPLVQRQLAAMQLRTEQALSVGLFAAALVDEQERGAPEADALLRLLTPLIKFQACRDNLQVATSAMEMRGGNGYIEDWVNARLVRDAQIGVLWEGTSHIIALDVLRRAIRKQHCHHALAGRLRDMLTAAALPESERDGLRSALEAAVAGADRIAAADDGEVLAWEATSLLYHATAAVLLAVESAADAAAQWRSPLAHAVVAHRLRPLLERVDPGGKAALW